MLKAIYINHMGNDLTTVNAARISFGNEAETLTERDEKLIGYLARNEHMSPFEHNVLTVMIECPLYIRSQIHRHRTFSYNEVSRRYTVENLEFYVPPVEDIRSQSKSNKQTSDGLLPLTTAKAIHKAFETHCKKSLELLELMIKNGMAREQARAILSQALMTKFYMTGNLRNWVHFVKLRQHSHAQKEVQEIALAIKAIIIDKFPVSAKALFGE